MKKGIFSLIVSVFFLLTACGEGHNTAVVESGTYTGVAEKVEDDEREIYFRISEEELVELYFTDETKLMNNDNQMVEFDELEEGGNVEVSIEKKGNKNVPLSVKILD